MKYMILGSSGAFGTAVEKVCKEKDIECVGLNHEDIEITNQNELIKAIEKHKPDVVINSVAMVGINPCEIETKKAFDINSIAVLNLAKICNENNILLVQPSTHAVFDGTKDDYYTEEDYPNPAGAYAVSKYAAECFAKSFCSKHYVVRFPTLFGPRRNKSPGFVDKVFEWINEGKELKIADDKIDTPTYTLDAARMLVRMIETKKPYGTYHLANSGKTSYYSFILKLIEILGTNTKVIAVKDRDFKTLAYKPLKTALKSIKLEPLRSWEEALKEYVVEELKGAISN